MRLFLIMAAMLFGACPAPTVNPDINPLPPSPDGSVKACGAAATLAQDDLCPDTFTSQGVPCVSCKGGQGCAFHGKVAYCVKAGGCAKDPACAKR